MFLKTIPLSICCTGKSLKILQFVGPTISNTAIRSSFRFLYSSESLGLDSYLRGREKTALQFQDLRDKFYHKMFEYSDPTSLNMVFTEDLKNILHLAEKKAEDLKLVKQMIFKFNSQNKELRFGAYTFGPVVMRLYHHLNQPDEALELFLHEDFKTFFTQNNSYHLLMDLLFKNERYEDIIKLFDIVESRQSQGTRYPRSLVNLYLAALYKINTPEALDRVKCLYTRLNASGHNHVRRSICFAAALALRQGQYNEAIEFLALIPGTGTYVTMRNIKILAMSGVTRYDDVLDLLHAVLKVDVPDTKLTSVKQTIFADVAERLESDFESVDNVELKSKFTRVLQQLKEFDHVSSQTLEDHLLAEIKEVKPQRFNQDRESAQIAQSRYNVNNGDRQYNARRPYRRPGLSDMS